MTAREDSIRDMVLHKLNPSIYRNDRWELSFFFLMEQTEVQLGSSVLIQIHLHNLR